MNRAILEYDFSVLEGFRGEDAQNYAFDNGFSKVRWPFGKHNIHPSRAVDIAPYPVRWNDPVRFTELSIIIKRIAGELMIPIKWGGDWGWDLAHWELV
jgi:peptidoglycan L-alanyl-D-glutamate endopeptidase CwlK